MNAIGVGSILTYNYRLVNVEADGINKAQFQTDILELLKPDVVRQACTTPETREGLLERGVELRFVYYDQHREYLSDITVTVQTCR